MNIFEKLQDARVELQNMGLKKSGKNSFTGFSYFELKDFLPMVNEIFKNKKLFSKVSFTEELATLTIINAEKTDEIVEFTSPMRHLELKGCNDIQALGGVETYQRRYLYFLALEIIENDAFDKVAGSADNKQIKKDEKPKDTITIDQAKELIKISGNDEKLFTGMIAGYGYKKSTDIKTKDYDAIKKALENAVSMAIEG